MSNSKLPSSNNVSRDSRLVNPIRTQIQMDSKIGPLFLVGSEEYLHGVYWKKQNVPLLEFSMASSKSILKMAVQELDEYLSGRRRKFEVPLEPEGTKFQKKVWEALRKIPYGETCSYKDIAVAVNEPNASRAVGAANGQNPISIIVPCHRVISSQGTLGGFAGGLPIKKALLELELAKLIFH